MTFWDWFIRPFAEIAAGLAIVVVVGAIYIVAVYVHEKFKRK